MTFIGMFDVDKVSYNVSVTYISTSEHKISREREISQWPPRPAGRSVAEFE